MLLLYDHCAKNIFTVLNVNITRLGPSPFQKVTVFLLRTITIYWYFHLQGSKICHTETKKDPAGLPGRKAFLSPQSLLFIGKTPASMNLLWIPKGRFKLLLIRERVAKKLPEVRLKGPQKLIKTRRQTSWDKTHILILSAATPLNYGYRVSESRSVLSDSLWPHGVYSPWNSLGQSG